MKKTYRIIVLDFSTGKTHEHEIEAKSKTGASKLAVNILSEMYGLDNIQWMLVEKNPDEFIERWHTEDAQSACGWLTDEQARQVIARYLDRDFGDDFIIIRTIAEEMFPEESEAHHAAN